MQVASTPAMSVATVPLAKLRGASLAELQPLLMVGSQAANLIAQAGDPVAALTALEAALLYTEAARLMAHALPRREAVWWACMCARHTAPRSLPDADLRALEAAEAWVFRSEDSVRRAGFEQAQAAGFGSPEAWSAVAAFWSGDSMAPADQAPVPPASHLANTAVAGSIALAAVRGRPERRAARLARFLQSGREIASGGTGRLPPEED
jgi:uncharacterized protein DUF6931